MGVSHTVKLGRVSPRNEDQQVERPWVIIQSHLYHPSSVLSTGDRVVAKAAHVPYQFLLQGVWQSLRWGALNLMGLEHRKEPSLRFLDTCVAAFVVQLKGTDFCVSSMPRLRTAPELNSLASWRVPPCPPPSVQMGELRPRAGKGHSQVLDRL